MNKKAVKEALEPSAPDLEVSPTKYEEEVTVDLNTTQTNQERSYKEFIKKEVKSEASNFMKQALNHECRLSACFLLYILPWTPRRTALSFAAYFLMLVLEILVGSLKRRYIEKKKVSGNKIIFFLEYISVILIILITDELYIKLLLPIYLILAIFGIAMKCMSFSDTLDELFYLKMVRLYYLKFTTVPSIVFTMQFVICQLKRSQIVGWTWISVMSPCVLIIFIFAILGFFLVIFSLFEIVKGCLKKALIIRGRLLT